jgi:hypothetical protein
MDVGKKAIDALKEKIAATHPDYADGTIAIIKDTSGLLAGMGYGTYLRMHATEPAPEMVLVRVPREQLAAIKQRFPGVQEVERISAPPDPSIPTGTIEIPIKAPTPPAPEPSPSPLDGWDPVKTEISDPMGMVVLGRLEDLK